MEDRETARMHKYGESKTTRIMMANCTARHFRFGTWKISGRWIFVDTSLLSLIRLLHTAERHLSCARGIKTSIAYSWNVVKYFIQTFQKYWNGREV